MSPTLHEVPPALQAAKVKPDDLIRHRLCPSWRVDTGDVHTKAVRRGDLFRHASVNAGGCTAEVCPRVHGSLTRNHRRQLVREGVVLSILMTQRALSLLSPRLLAKTLSTNHLHHTNSLTD